VRAEEKMGIDMDRELNHLAVDIAEIEIKMHQQVGTD
jgi:hypothetical protein